MASPIQQLEVPPALLAVHNPATAEIAGATVDRPVFILHVNADVIRSTEYPDSQTDVIGADVSAFGRSTPIKFLGGNSFKDPDSTYLEDLMASIFEQRYTQAKNEQAQQRALFQAQNTPLEERQRLADEANEAAKRHAQRSRLTPTGWLRQHVFSR